MIITIIVGNFLVILAIIRDNTLKNLQNWFIGKNIVFVVYSYFKVSLKIPISRDKGHFHIHHFDTFSKNNLLKSSFD